MNVTEQGKAMKALEDMNLIDTQLLNTGIDYEKLPDRDIKCMIAESYDLISDSLTKRIYEAVKKIPKGKVATYGQIAELVGEIAFGGVGEQEKLLVADGIEVTDGRVNLKKYQWEEF